MKSTIGLSMYATNHAAKKGNNTPLSLSISKINITNSIMPRESRTVLSKLNGLENKAMLNCELGSLVICCCIYLWIDW